MTTKLWGGRFDGATDPLMHKYNASIDVDRRLWQEDIDGSIAYARELAHVGVLTADEATTLVDGLNQVAELWRTGQFVLDRAVDEDIHTANERQLTAIVGAVGGKLHTGRSRNEQVVLDTRLWLKTASQRLRRLVGELCRTAAAHAEEHMDAVMPGYTHLQPAQPVRYSHWLLAHAFAWLRDAERLRDAEVRVDVSPLGCGALAGSALGVDRTRLGAALGLARVSANSMDTVADRDFVAEYLFVLALFGTHVSRFAEDLIFFSTRKFVHMADAYCTGSSLMPQKRNPDCAELLRGQAGGAIGRLVAMLTTLKSLPFTYNKDLQDDKRLLFSAVDDADDVVQLCTGLIATMKINAGAMLADLSTEMLATDLADHLVRRGVPFREAHHIVGSVVKLAETRRVGIDKLPLADLRAIDARFGDDVATIFDFEVSVESRDSIGGTSRRSVCAQLADLRERIAALAPAEQ
jgi:argininosuccinate lyase